MKRERAFPWTISRSGLSGSGRAGDRLHMLDARRQPVELVRLDLDTGVPVRAAAFQPPGPPPVVLREAASGLLHIAYREVAIRFRRKIPWKRRQAILRDQGFEVCRTNPFIPGQVVVHDPENRRTGEQLIEVANRWMEMEEVVFAAPSFVSQFQRQALPSIRPEEWHLREIGVAEAWRKTAGDPGIVVAVLDDGVDVEHPNLIPNLWRNPNPRSLDVIGRDFFLPPGDPGHFDPRPKRFSFPFDRVEGNDIHGTACAGLREILAGTADQIGADHDAQGHSPQVGFGRVNADGAVAVAAALSERLRKGRSQ